MRAGVYMVRPDPTEPWEALPTEQLQGAPTDRTFYMADVDEIGLDGSVTLSLWESPSGRALYGNLGVLRPEERSGPEPRPGDRLLIWTWSELPGEGVVQLRRYIKVERRVLTDAEKQELLKLAASLESEGAESP